MSAAAISMCKDEADVVTYWLDWTLSQVDRVYVLENGSTDGTREILLDRAESDPRLVVIDDPETGYYQSRKMSALGQRAFEDGFAWLVAADLDEFWYSPDGRRIADFLAGHAPDVQLVRAAMYHHIPTALDPPAECARCESTGTVTVIPAVQTRDFAYVAEPWQAPCPVCAGLVEPNPFRRIGWRKREHGALPKVACRCRPDLVIHAGNHGATTRGTALAVSGLVIRHFSWRSPEGYVRKIRNGIAAYAATDLPETTGEHWRMWEGKTDEQIAGHYETWFHSADPYADDSLIYDPAPGA